MLGYDQNPIVIFNPLSYLDLQSGLHGLDEYLQCTSTGGTGIGERKEDPPIACETLRPSINILERQGVSSIAVLSRLASRTL